MGVPPLDVDHWAAHQVRGCLHWSAACTRSHGNISYYCWHAVMLRITEPPFALTHCFADIEQKKELGCAQSHKKKQNSWGLACAAPAAKPS